MTRGALLIAFASLVVAAASAWQWTPNIGDGPSTVCLSRPAPGAVGADPTWAPEATQSWWPLGVMCRWTHAVSGETVEAGPGPGPTVVAVTALGVGLGGVMTAVGELRSRRRGTVIPAR